MILQMQLNLVPIEDCPPEWKDQRPLLAFSGNWDMSKWVSGSDPYDYDNHNGYDRRWSVVRFLGGAWIIADTEGWAHSNYCGEDGYKIGDRIEAKNVDYLAELPLNLEQTVIEEPADDN